MPSKDALIVVDVQNDFCPGGALAVKDGDQVIPALNRHIDKFIQAGLPIFATRDWHPAITSHFNTRGGPWPPHCIQGSKGAQFHPDLKLPPDTVIVSAGIGSDEDGYSGFLGINDGGKKLLTSFDSGGTSAFLLADWPRAIAFSIPCSTGSGRNSRLSCSQTLFGV